MAAIVNDMGSNLKADVILPAAGLSERMKLHTAKQFINVLGHPIIAYTIECFHRLLWIRHIIVLVNDDQVETMKGLIKSYGFVKVSVHTGSYTRHRSIFSGIKALEAACFDTDVVLIHDAARPVVCEEIIHKVASAAKTHGAAGVTRPLVSTVVKGDTDSKLYESLERSSYRNSEMPQGFQYSVVASAYEKSSTEDLNFGTECLLLVMKYTSCRALLLEGTDELWKVTYKQDLFTLESVLKEKLTSVSILNKSAKDLQRFEDEIKQKLKSYQLKLSDCEKTPANTYVVYTDPTNINLVEITSTVAKGYIRSSSPVKLRLLMVMVFVFDQQPDATFKRSDQQSSNESFENQKKSEDQFNCFPQPVLDWQYCLQKTVKAIKRQLDMIYKINPIIVGVICKVSICRLNTNKIQINKSRFHFFSTGISSILFGTEYIELESYLYYYVLKGLFVFNI
ncbi:D-ribitol-5-phosphate cytidylyltransferase-like isoform X3 [Physella acuta]|uniref:D-ribitol-5-phosphate cytidylyltransferase-like isoform X3 n=1 Tax=Physella acuta TaxID=109671 RepID=UPI0027DCF6B5|nr:D-ribitol-5-phosphate cytidylyltransferase-like isoform X3 [Physella acuta]